LTKFLKLIIFDWNYTLPYVTTRRRPKNTKQELLDAFDEAMILLS